jgi:hypothetical protein
VTDWRIIYNRKDDGGVSVCCPTDWALAAMCSGGAWREFPWFYPGFDEIQIERMIGRGVRADTAQTYARAMMDGGCTTAEALAIIRDRDCAPLGTAIELWDMSELPADRWFRDAWRRSHNGGPIEIDLDKARPVQFARARAAIERENAAREASFDLWKPAIEVDWHATRRQIARARSIEELRTIWPEGLPCRG